MFKNYISKIVLAVLEKELYAELKKLQNPVVKIKFKDGARIFHATSASAGYDVFNELGIDVILAPGERRLIPVGVFMQLPVGIEAQVRPTSGNAINLGISVLNSPGTIDADYPKEIAVILVNHSTEEVRIKAKQKVAQLIFAQHCIPEFQYVNEIIQTTERIGGFGSTEK